MISVCKLNFDELKVYADEAEKTMNESGQAVLTTDSKEILGALDATAEKEFLLVKYTGPKIENLDSELEFIKIPKCKNFFMFMRRCPELHMLDVMKFLENFGRFGDEDCHPLTAAIDEDSDGEYEVDYLINLDEKPTEVFQDKFRLGDI